jgi:oxalate decarboxylase
MLYDAMLCSPLPSSELHWHRQAEWGLVLTGTCRITAVDQNGRNFIKDVSPGQVWYFPEGVPHSIQGLKDGVQFLLVFNDGTFNEESTFGLSDWVRRVPMEVLAKNFGISKAAFRKAPKSSLYIFQGEVPGRYIGQYSTVQYSAGLDLS